MTKLPTGLTLVTALAAAALVFTTMPGFGADTAQAATAATPVKFGMDANAIAAQKAAGVAPDYGTMWIGPWTLTSGWGGPDAELASMKNAGVTPAVHFYYWGDDISPSCVENGCWSSLHDAQKTRAGWDKLGTQLTQHLTTQMGGKPVVVFLESEFNKGGISTYEPFDGYMAGMARKIHAGYPNAIVVLGFGAWDSGNWYRFDQVAAESDMVGVQAMRGSTKDSLSHYNGVYEGTLASVQKLDTLFGKPVMLTDLALSSYPDASYLSVQDANLKEIFANLGTLKAAGLQSIVYRSWTDSPSMDTANYYGQAERHWGLVKADGTQKAAAKTWIAGVKAERAGSTTSAPTPTGTTTTTGLTATVTPSGNEWWVQAKVSSTKAITKVEAKVNGGAYVALAKQDYGWAKSLNAPKGSTVTFKVTASDGSTATTPGQAWMVDMTAKTAKSGTASTTTTTAAATTTTASTAFKATFTPKAQGNDWWVETAVTGNQGIAKVQAKVNAGSWVTLDKTSYGTYAKSINAPNGATVTFRATSTSGATYDSIAYGWP